MSALRKKPQTKPARVLLQHLVEAIELALRHGGGRLNVHVSEDEALSHVAGVAAALDVSLAGAGSPPRLDTTARDTFAPLGPYIVPALYYDRLKMTVAVNGATVGAGAGMIELVARLVSSPVPGGTAGRDADGQGPGRDAGTL